MRFRTLEERRVACWLRWAACAAIAFGLLYIDGRGGDAPAAIAGGLCVLAFLSGYTLGMR